MSGLWKMQDLLYHYEIIILRQGHEQILARVATRRQAAQRIFSAQQRLEISRQSVQIRRARGVHPRKAAAVLAILLLITIILPWWVQIGIGLIGLSVILGLLTSGTQWMQGGTDDR